MFNTCFFSSCREPYHTAKEQIEHLALKHFDQSIPVCVDAYIKSGICPICLSTTHSDYIQRRVHIESHHSFDVAQTALEIVIIKPFELRPPIRVKDHLEQYRALDRFFYTKAELEEIDRRNREKLGGYFR